MKREEKFKLKKKMLFWNKVYKYIGWLLPKGSKYFYNDKGERIYIGEIH